MHNFCQSCYSQWKKKNEICPECRETVITFRRNHAIIQLVEAYLKTHPEKQRSLEEIKELDQNCDITDEMVT